MATETSNRILAEFMPQVEAACRDGRGEALLFDFYKRQAEGVADGVFLLAQKMVAEADPDTDAEALLDAIQALSVENGHRHVEGVAELCVTRGMPAEHQVKAETISGDAFRERLNLHFASTGWGGNS